MLSDKDLVFLGACMLVGKFSTNIDDAIMRSEEIFEKVFTDENNKDGMILE